MDKEFDIWYEDLQKRIVERGLDKYQVHRMDMMSESPHWVMEMQSDNYKKMLKLAKDIASIKLPDSEEPRYQVRLYDKDNNRDVDLING